MRHPTHFTTRDFREVPRTSTQLHALGVTKAERKQYFEPCTYGTWVAKPEKVLRAMGFDTFSKVTHPKNIPNSETSTLAFPHDVRVRGHYMAHPTWIAGGISALRIRGFPYFHDKQPAHMITPTTRGKSRAEAEARRSTMTKPFTPEKGIDLLLPELPVAPTAVAASQFLKEVALQKHRWFNHFLPDFPAAELRLIQAADALCNFTRQSPQELLASMDAALPTSRKAKRLIEKHCRTGAESPPETWVRLLLQPLIPDLETQVPVSDKAGHIATADLGSREHRLLIFYDGAYHSEQDQREWDTEVNSRLSALGIRVLRLSAQSMRHPEQIKSRVQAIIQQAR